MGRRVRANLRRRHAAQLRSSLVLSVVLVAALVGAVSWWAARPGAGAGEAAAPRGFGVGVDVGPVEPEAPARPFDEVRVDREAREIVGVIQLPAGWRADAVHVHRVPAARPAVPAGARRGGVSRVRTQRGHTRAAGGRRARRTGA